jgi:hypothetical protein
MLRGTFMKMYARIIVALTFLFGLGVAANAEMQPQVAVTLPFDFVAGKTTLPAGKYIVRRISEQPFDVLMLTRSDTGASVFVGPVEMESASDDKPKLSFHKVGEQHVLSAIQTADYVYNFRVSPSVILAAAAAKPRDAAPVSASGGSK